MLPSVPPSGSPADLEEKIRHLPPVAQTAFRRFVAEGDLAALDVVTVAILEDFMPRTPARPRPELRGDSNLMGELGLDSLAITEVVFFAEDLLGIRISNEEILEVRTVDDLRGFIRRKVSERSAG
jgi:acyl carrier protein